MFSRGGLKFSGQCTEKIWPVSNPYAPVNLGRGLNAGFFQRFCVYGFPGSFLNLTVEEVVGNLDKYH